MSAERPRSARRPDEPLGGLTASPELDSVRAVSTAGSRRPATCTSRIRGEHRLRRARGRGRRGRGARSPLTSAARWRRSRGAGATLAARVVGITGSAGKTTTKDIRAALAAAPTHAAEGSLNNETGVPLTLCRLVRSRVRRRRDGDARPRADRVPHAMARPDVAVVTTVGPSTSSCSARSSAVARRRARSRSACATAAPSCPGRPLLESFLAEHPGARSVRRGEPPTSPGPLRRSTPAASPSRARRVSATRRSPTSASPRPRCSTAAAALAAALACRRTSGPARGRPRPPLRGRGSRDRPARGP